VSDLDLDSSPDGVDAGDGDAPEAESSRRSPVLILAITLAILFAVAATVLGVVVAGQDDSDPRLEDVRAAAGRFGEALVTYDYRDPDAHKASVLALSTGSFRQSYEEAFDQGLARIITEVQATSTGFVKDIYVSEIDEERAQAIVVVDIEHDGSGGPRTLFDVYFRLTFVEVDGTWKVDQVTDLNFDAGATPTDPTGSTTSTTAPGTTTTSVP
jgi:hypothetical protein